MALMKCMLNLKILHRIQKSKLKLESNSFKHSASTMDFLYEQQILNLNFKVDLGISVVDFDI